MSAPDTNIERQKSKHKVPLVGMAAVVIFALTLLGALMLYLSDDAGVPEGAEVQIDGRTGEEVVVED